MALAERMLNARFGDELARIGYVGAWPCPGPAPYAFVELHIEQGPVLEAEGVRIGAVTPENPQQPPHHSQNDVGAGQPSDKFRHAVPQHSVTLMI